ANTLTVPGWAFSGGDVVRLANPGDELSQRLNLLVVPGRNFVDVVTVPYRSSTVPRLNTNPILISVKLAVCHDGSVHVLQHVAVFVYIEMRLHVGTPRGAVKIQITGIAHGSIHHYASSAANSLRIVLAQHQRSGTWVPCRKLTSAHIGRRAAVLTWPIAVDGFSAPRPRQALRAGLFRRALGQTP